MITKEAKYVTTANATAIWCQNSAAVAGAPVYDPWAARFVVGPMAQGTGNSEREGRYINCEYLSIKANLWKNEDFVDTNSTAGGIISDRMGPRNVTIFVILDTQNNGSSSTPNWNDIFANTGQSQIQYDQARRNIEWMRRFKILRKKTCRFSANISGSANTAGETIVAGGNKNMELFIPLHGMQFHYLGAGSNQADLVDNCIHVVAVTDGWAPRQPQTVGTGGVYPNPNGNHDIFSIEWDYRLKYRD
jgi:hypothetical protein